MAFRRQVKNFVKNYSDAEIKVREATSNDPWGPSSSLMLDISDLTFNTISLSEIMNMLWHRLNDHGKNWRHVYKSLTLMDYLIKNGSKKVIQHCREGFCNLQTLKDFQHIDEAGKDQGYYIREKSKQVITLLMDEPLLCKEREVACRTRQRTSHSILFSKRQLGSSNSLTACTSAPTPDISASEKKYKLPKFGRLHNKRNVCKAGLKQEHCQDVHLPTETMLSQETLPLKIHGWKSTEDLMTFLDDDPELPLLATPPSIVSPITCLSEAEEVCNLSGADAVPTLSENSPSGQRDVSLDKRSDGIFTNTVTENLLETPLEKQSAAEGLKTLTILPACWSSKEEFISPDLRVSKSDSTFHNQASVETLCLSPSFKIFDRVKEIVINKAYQKPAQSSIQMDDKILKTTTRASPEKSAHLLSPILAGPSFWTLSHQQLSSTSFKDEDKTAKLHHSFASRGPVSSDVEENDSLNLLGILPNNSDSAKKNISHISSSHWGEFSTQNVDQFIPLSCSGFQSTKDFPQEPEAKNSISVLLREVKRAIARLHEDLSTVIQELNVINNILMSMSLNSSQISQSSQVPQSSEGSSDQI
ncbi:ENTH domain-containing protein 1 isoform X2 [Homo sapiens]|uniref:ENTH domain-containing protein 1 isoform X2 n=1 Tax=Homo sapiens TaxID=9606 RepID=UPI0005D028A1|nr:ENTH domain-containing protein 1 isoform X2 [Homo sapiens]XP_054181125.1 ENTH domain-containing protein 1 isoform X2 [Homo sapiens]|eukprot:XP_011528229.1 ENTH domain-containing protein 1 isoform X2 [Homo sapiens]